MRLLQLLLVVFVCGLCSCKGWHIEKRHYRNGFYFDRVNASGSAQVESKEITDSSRAATSTQFPIDISEAHRDTTKPELRPETTTGATNTNNTSGNYHEEIIVESSVSSDTKLPEEDPVERQIKKTKVLGTVALLLVIIGLAGLEATIFTFPLLLIGIGCAIFGLRMGKLALQNTRSKTRDKDGNKVADPKRVRAKRAYWLSLAALLLVAAYAFIRIIIAGGGNTIVIAFALAGLCLLAYLLFKMGVFDDLGAE